MHILSVTAEAFGPLVDETLPLSPGLTVVHGDNESAKSSWHAAIYAGLCGRRRGRGANRAEDREFADRRRPWDRDSWKVRCVVTLDDGRTVTLQHDLDGKVDCRALDERGRDVSGEIMYDGAPDGSVWLGLNRRTFAATACVNQAELLHVLDAADELQKDIQRAAATAGKDETAASALTALKKFATDHVGLDRVNSRKPLRRTLEEQQRARAAYAEAMRAHEDYLHLVVEAQQAAQKAAAATADRLEAEAAKDDAERVVQLAQSLAAARAAAAQAQALAAQLRAKATTSQAHSTKARELSASLPDSEPASSNEGDTATQRVARALGGWQSAPEVPRLKGPSSQDLRAQIDNLPELPDGDVDVDPTVERLRDAYLQAAAVVERDERNRVQPPDRSDQLTAAVSKVDPSALRWLAERLADPVAEIDPRLPHELDAASRQRHEAGVEAEVAEQQESAALEAARRGGVLVPVPARPAVVAAMTMAAGAALLAVGVALLVLGQSVAGVVLTVIGGGAVGAGVFLRRSAGVDTPDESTPGARPDVQLEAARERVRNCREASLRAERAYLDAEARLDAARRTVSLSAARRQAAVDEAGALGLPADAGELRSLADHGQRALSRREAFERWHREHDADEQARRSSEERLAAALSDRGYTSSVDVLQAYTAYERGCASRAEQARIAHRRDGLASALRDRLESEQAAERAQHVRDAAVHELQQAAHSVDMAAADESTGSTGAAADVLAERLRGWLEMRKATLEETDEQRRHWQQLQTLLDGRSLDELDSAAAADLEAAALAEQAAGDADAEVDDDAQALESAAAEAAVSVLDEAGARELLLARRQRLEVAVHRERELAHEASNQHGAVVERERSIPNVAEAEEAVERATRELERVRSLDEVLSLTTSFLETAQETTYTTLAPVLSQALNKWLPHVTGGRYRRALVDPETLAVHVESETGVFRRAELLSVGTAEQVYLLLRVALAEHLASKSTMSPLLLDDVTVQADPTRTEAILRMCKALADEGRQVVLFAQEPSVASWAESNLDGTQHTLVRLTVPAA